MEEHSNRCSESRCIEPVTFEQLHTALSNATRDPGTEGLLDAELVYIKKWRNVSGRNLDESGLRDNLSGLAISGGGIRSATFALGVIQALAHYDLLKKFDYLSTVSGGGYIGSALTWLFSKKANDAAKDNPNGFSAGKDDFPYGIGSPTSDTPRKDSPSQRAMLNFLRSHGYYLAPGGGINIFALIGVILRGTALNLIVWLPLGILVLISGFWIPGKISLSSPWLKSLLERIPDGGYAWSDAFNGYELLLRFGASIVILLLIGIVVYSFLTRRRRVSKQSNLSAAAWYDWRRRAEKWASRLLPLSALLFIIGLLPVATSYMSAVGPLAVIAGIAMHLRGFLTSLGPDSKPSSSVIAPIGAALFLYGFFALAFQLAYAVWPIHKSDDNLFILILGCLVAIPIISGFWVNLNYISIHRFYRDRLMESFMPDIDKALKNITGAASGADSAYLSDFVDTPNSPYHLINTNVVLVDSANQIYQTRGGDNFILSPYYCGSNATGWCPTGQYMEGGMTLATAMAISGAALGPNAGVGGEGVTRNRILSFVLTLLNLRLSYWAHNPIKKIPKVLRIPNHFIPGLVYALGSVFGSGGFNEDGAFVELSDGGHFENLAIYELIRRKAKLILVSDAGQDEEFTFSDLQTTVRRIENDFGVGISFHNDGLDSVIPYDRQTPAYPPDTKFSWQGYIVADILYPRPDFDLSNDEKYNGLLVYIKSTLLKSSNFKIKGYKAQNPAFPHQSTADQFFDEVQFEAYRELGYTIAENMIRDKRLDFSSRLGC